MSSDLKRFVCDIPVAQQGDRGGRGARVEAENDLFFYILHIVPPLYYSSSFIVTRIILYTTVK